jgi:hypothetical protein
VSGARWQKGNKASKQLAAIDQLLIAGIKQGPGKKRQAINRILELVPEWTRGDCWKRIRHLRKTHIDITATVLKAPTFLQRNPFMPEAMLS